MFVWFDSQRLFGLLRERERERGRLERMCNGERGELVIYSQIQASTIKEGDERGKVS